jgi:hypothetical protein
MRSLGGFVLLAGIGVGLFVYLPAPVDGSLSLAQIGDIDTPAGAKSTQIKSTHITLPAETTAARPTRSVGEESYHGGLRLRSFSPNVALANFVQTAAVPAAVPAGADTVVSSDASGAWQAVVAPSAGTAQSASLAPHDESTRYKLITDIQQHLKRVGCYYGRIDGSWGASTKDAMRTFTDRVNAELPLDEPDYLLLSLLQSHSEKACGECPPGLALSANGRCVPQPVVAQSHPGDAPKAAAPVSETREAKATLPWQIATTVAPAAPPPAAKPLFTPATTSIVSTEPLPGRMAIGGPKELPPVDSANADPAYAATNATIGASAGQTALATPAPANAAPHASAPRRASYSERHEGASSSGRSRGESPGTPRYNLLLSLGGVY